MKKRLLCNFLIVMGLVSCEKNDIFELDGHKASQNLEATKAVTVYPFGGKPITYNYGYGFRANDGNLDYDFAWANYKKPTRSANIKARQTQTAKIIKTKKSIDSLYAEDAGFAVSIGIPLASFPIIGGIDFGISYRSRQATVRQSKLSENTESIVIRITNPVNSFATLEDRLEYSDEAIEFLDKNGINKFCDRYGTSWVSSEYGIMESIFTFSFDTKDLTEQEQNEFQEALLIAIAPIIGVGYSKQRIENSISQVKNRIKRQQVTTNLSGYPLRFVGGDLDFDGYDDRNGRNLFDPFKLEEEKDRMIEYSIANPNAIGYVSKKLRPYFDPDPNVKKNKGYNRAFYLKFRESQNCAYNAEQWGKLKARITVVAKKTSDNGIKARATAALRTIQRNLDAAEKCSSNSKPPKRNAYNNIKLEKF